MLHRRPVFPLFEPILPVALNTQANNVNLWNAPPWRWRGWIAPAAFLLAAAAALSVDLELARWCLGEHCPGSIRRLLNSCEPFGHGSGAALVVFAVFLLDPSRRWLLPRVVLCTAAGGMAANLCKLLVARTRPLRFCFTDSSNVWDTFGAWLPSGGGFAQQSFPSAHTGAAVALAYAMSRIYPAGRPLFWTLAAGVALQRVDSGCHFASDVLAAVALGLMAGQAFFSFGMLPGWFSRLETIWAGSTVPAAEAGTVSAMEASAASRRPAAEPASVRGRLPRPAVCAAERASHCGCGRPNDSLPAHS